MRLKCLLLPLNIAAILTVAAVGATLAGLPPAHWPLVYGLLGVFAILMLLADLLPTAPRWVHHAALVAMGGIWLFLLWHYPRAGAVPILSVVWAAMVASTWRPRVAAAALLGANIVAWWILEDAGYRSALMSVVLVACFQLFAAITVHYARSAEEARDRLAQVNADLLATRALLADSARDGERLRVARELHDVAGHKLTALRLNLRALQAASPSPQLQLVEQLSAELMGDIRDVVHALRDAGGLDIDTALRALAAPYPRPALQLSIDEGVVVDDPALAETVLRTVQEALTNAARHGLADTLDVRLRRDGTLLRVDIEDDGRATLPLREGHGLTGMRERIDALGGSLRIDRAARGGVRIEAAFPA